MRNYYSEHENLAMIATFKSYKIKYNYTNKERYLSLEFERLIDGSGNISTEASLSSTYRMQNLGLLQPGDTLYFEGRLDQVGFYDKDKFNVKICANIENACLLNRAPKKFPLSCIGTMSNDNNLIIKNMLEYILEKYPDADKDIDKEWNEIIASTRYRFNISDRLYRLITPQYSSTLKFEVDEARHFEIIAKEFRNKRPAYLVKDFESGKEFLLGQRFINRARDRKKIPFDNLLFFTSKARAEERAYDLNIRLLAFGKLPDLL